MKKEGLVDDKLAMQYGEEEELLQQLLQAIDLQPSVVVERWLLAKLVEAVEEQKQRLPLIKRLKGEATTWEYQALEDFKLSFTSQPSATAIFQPPPEIPRPGGRARFMREGQENEQDINDVLEQERLADVIIAYLLEQDLPNPKAAQQTTAPWKIMRGAMGDTRLGTMKVYWRVWRSFTNWLSLKRQLAWPTSHLQVVEYLHEAVNEPCARSHPQSLIQALAWMERAGGVRAADQLSKEPLLLRTVDFVVGKLSQGMDPAKQAPRIPMLAIAAMEAYVCNKKMPIYLRYRAFTILFKVWATMRQDDLQQLTPGRLRMVSDSVVGELMRTKTTGATKRVREVPIIISSDASITGMPWLQVGMKLIADHQLFPRKYMLPTKGAPFGTQMAKYAAASAASKQVLSCLQRPRAWTKSANASPDTPPVVWDYVQTELPIIPPALLDFWTEHSPRACMPSWTGLMGVEKSVRDLLGRWSPTGSEDYTRTYRLTVKKLQQEVVAALRAGDERLEEDDIWEKLPRYVNEHPEQCVGFDAAQWVARWKKLSEMFVAELKKKGPYVPGTVQEEPEVEEVFPDDGFGPASLAAEAATANADGVARAKKFVIVYSRNRKFARLRSTSSNCPWSRADVFDSSEVDVALPEQYNARCKICWPTRLATLEEESDCWESDESVED
jgi:hypothetical protein